MSWWKNIEKMNGSVSSNPLSEIVNEAWLENKRKRTAQKEAKKQWSMIEELLKSVSVGVNASSSQTETDLLLAPSKQYDLTEIRKFVTTLTNLLATKPPPQTQESLFQAKSKASIIQGYVEDISRADDSIPGKLFYDSIENMDKLVSVPDDDQDSETVSMLAFNILQAISPFLCHLTATVELTVEGVDPQETAKEFLSPCYEHILRQFTQSIQKQYPQEKHRLKLEAVCNLLLTQKAKVYNWGKLALESKLDIIKGQLKQQRLTEAKYLLAIFSQAANAMNSEHWRTSTWHPCIQVVQQAFNHYIQLAQQILRNQNTVKEPPIDQIYQALACIYHRLITVRVFLEQTEIRANEWSHSPKSTSAVYSSLRTLSDALEAHSKNNNGSNMFEFASVVPSKATTILEHYAAQNGSNMFEFAPTLPGSVKISLPKQNEVAAKLGRCIAQNEKKCVIKILLDAKTTEKVIPQKQHWLIALLTFFVPAKLIMYAKLRLDVHGIFSSAAKTQCYPNDPPSESAEAKEISQIIPDKAVVF
jgi:hypothetical protein